MMTLPDLTVALARRHLLRLADKGAYLKLRLHEHAPLHVERFGERLVVVGHTFGINGGLVRQPEFTYLIEAGGWRPVSFRFGDALHDCVELDDQERIIRVDPSNELIVRQSADAFASVLIEDGWLDRGRAVVVQPALEVPSLN